MIGNGCRSQCAAIGAHCHDYSCGRQFARMKGSELKSDGGTPYLRHQYLNVDQIVMPQYTEEIALDVNARKVEVTTCLVSYPECAQELDLGCFKVTEHRGEVNSATGICIDEADTSLKAEGLPIGHPLTMSRLFCRKCDTRVEYREALQCSCKPVQRTITGFHRDEHGDWVADLSCGHGLHMRHNPPWQIREWVLTPEGRQAFIGRTVNCKKCSDAEQTGSPSSE